MRRLPRHSGWPTLFFALQTPTDLASRIDIGPDFDCGRSGPARRPGQTLDACSHISSGRPNNVGIAFSFREGAGYALVWATSARPKTSRKDLPVRQSRARIAQKHATSGPPSLPDHHHHHGPGERRQPTQARARARARGSRSWPTYPTTDRPPWGRASVDLSFRSPNEQRKKARRAEH